MVDQFKREGFKNDITGNSLAYADLYLPRAYTVKQKAFYERRYLI